MKTERVMIHPGCWEVRCGNAVYTVDREGSLWLIRPGKYPGKAPCDDARTLSEAVEMIERCEESLSPN